MVVNQTIVHRALLKDKDSMGIVIDNLTTNVESYTENVQTAININLEVINTEGKVPKKLIKENLETLEELNKILLKEHNEILGAYVPLPPTINLYIGLGAISAIVLLGIHIYKIWCIYKVA